MSETKKRANTFTFIERMQLIKLRQKAIRAGVWFRALPRIDRVLVDLTIKVTDTIRSPNLAQSILVIAGKLEGILESKLARFLREFGLPITIKLSVFAQNWGYNAAGKWANDKDFARYWAVMKLNGHPANG
jgi:hypothetical protein